MDDSTSRISPDQRLTRIIPDLFDVEFFHPVGGKTNPGIRNGHFGAVLVEIFKTNLNFVSEGTGVTKLPPSLGLTVQNSNAQHLLLVDVHLKRV